jgi:hypothetical protein
MIERDIILAHQSGCQLRGAVDGAAKIVAPVYTHFDPDRRPVSLAFVISMLSSLVSREGLVNGMIVHSEMPGEKSSTIVTASEPLVHGERVIQCVGATRPIVGRMNSDKCRTHRPMQGTSAFPWGDDVLRDFQFGCTRRSRGDASGSHYAGRKEKPRQDNGKKPKRAKFYCNHSQRCERKPIKGCTARTVPDHSAFRKRNAPLMHEWEYQVARSPRRVRNALARHRFFVEAAVSAAKTIELQEVRLPLQAGAA